MNAGPEKHGNNGEDHPRAVEYWSRAMIPIRHRNARIDGSLNPQWAEALNKMQRRFDKSSDAMLALLGMRGRGKTQAAVELMRQAVKRGQPCRYTTAMGFFLHVKRSYSGESSQSEDGAINDFIRPQILCLDEIQDRGESAWENNLLTHLVDERYQRRLGTIFIGNLDEAQFRNCVGESIYSRMMETGGFVLFGGPSFRARD